MKNCYFTNAHTKIIIYNTCEVTFKSVLFYTRVVKVETKCVLSIYEGYLGELNRMNLNECKQRGYWCRVKYCTTLYFSLLEY
jgi:hypothetical protein